MKKRGRGIWGNGTELWNMTFKISLWYVVLAGGVAVTSRRRWTTLLHMRTLLSWGLDTMFCVMAESCVADRQRKSRWQLHAGLQDSVAPWKRVQDMPGWAEREGVSEDRISFCLSPSVRRDLTHCGLVHLSYLPPYLFLSLLLCLPPPPSLFHSLTIFPPSLSFGAHPNHTPLQQAWVCVCVCRCARACVYLRRIISMFDVCQNKGLISFTKN